MQNDPVIIAAFRSAIGKYGGILSTIRPDDMLASIIVKTIDRAKIQTDEIDEVVIGCANQAGEDNRNIARMAVLLSGLPNKVAAITLNRLCASGLDAIIDGARKIITGEAKVIISGGVESMSRAPFVLSKPVSVHPGSPQIFDSSLGWRFFNERMRERTPPEPNGITAERLVKEYKITRLRQDQFAFKSHQKAIKSQINGFFSDEIIPLSLTTKDEEILVEQDEGPRQDTNLEKLSLLKPVFLKDGTITAGNSSSLNDGAAVVILTSHEYARSNGLKPLARILGFASIGVDPKYMGLGPVFATEKLLKKIGCSINDFNSIEINEAFAAQVLTTADLLKINEEQINPHGGAIALGHPLGCSGARIVTTILNHMHKEDNDLGLASLCVGVGQGVSMAIEAI
jgi:acetyl-CoA acyltransferase